MARTTKPGDDDPLKKGAAAPKVLPDESQEGHNVTEETFFEHVKALTLLTAEKDNANANLRNGWKLAEEAGIDREALKLALKVKKRDEDRIKATFRTLDRYLKWLRIPTGTQIGMFQEEAPLDDAASISKAEDEGRFAYHENKNLKDNPHAINTARGQAWHKGFLDAEAGVIKGMAPKDANGADASAPAQ